MRKIKLNVINCYVNDNILSFKENNCSKPSLLFLKSNFDGSFRLELDLDFLKKNKIVAIVGCYFNKNLRDFLKKNGIIYVNHFSIRDFNNYFFFKAELDFIFGKVSIFNRNNSEEKIFNISTDDYDHRLFNDRLSIIGLQCILLDYFLLVFFIIKKIFIGYCLILFTPPILFFEFYFFKFHK